MKCPIQQPDVPIPHLGIPLSPARLKWAPFLLLLIGLISALLWRIELEVRWGWPGIEWISGPHISALIMLIVFSVWVYMFAPCRLDLSRLLRSLIVFSGGVLSYLLWGFAWSIWRARFPTGLFLPIACLFVTVLGIPWTICFVAWCFHPRFRHWNWLLVPLLFLLSFPVSILLLKITDHPGGADAIHAVKSGFVFIGFALAAGLPFFTSAGSRD
jgi:hypothetical protein